MKQWIPLALFCAAFVATGLQAECGCGSAQAAAAEEVTQAEEVAAPAAAEESVEG